MAFIPTSLPLIRPSPLVPCRSSPYGQPLSTRKCQRSRLHIQVKASFAQEQPPQPGDTYMKRMGALAIKDYLTARAVRTILFYCEEFHDGPTRDWLLRFEHFGDREKSIFRNGDQYILNMLYAPKEKCTVVVGHPRGNFRREFAFTIEPYRLAKRILSAREQLALEWAQDLQLVAQENLQLSRMQFEKIITQQRDERVLERKKDRVFDEATFKSQSPLRFRSYQNVKVLTTQHAAARLLTMLRDNCNHDYMWLLQFIRSYGAIKNGDELIKSIMKHEPETRWNPDFTVVPQRLAERLMELRVAVAEEWIDVLKQIPAEHMALQRHLLELSMMGGNQRLKVE